MLDRVLDLFVRHGLLVADEWRGSRSYQLRASCLQWCVGDGQLPPPDPLYSRRAQSEGYTTAVRPVNTFFQRFYQVDPQSLVALEAREHTA